MIDVKNVVDAAEPKLLMKKMNICGSVAEVRVCHSYTSFQGCNGYLANAVINFGDSLEKRVLSTAEDHAKRSDIVLCLGTSLRISPACDLVEMGQSPVRLVICNRFVCNSFDAGK